MVVLPSDMRGLNRRALFGCLRRIGVASRADLAKSLGMSAPTAGKIVDELIELGVLEEIDESPPARPVAGGPRRARRLGRPARLLRLEGRRPRFLALELGVRETRLALVPIAASGEEDWTVRFPTGSSASQWQQRLGQAARRLPANDLHGALLSTPGIVDEKAGRVLFSPNLHWTARTDLRRLVGDIWNLRVEVVQEERALALGHLAADPGGDDFLLVDFGEGVGGAMVSSGHVYQSPLPLSGELGHTPVLGNRRPCGCGATGCVETLVSRTGLLESFAAARAGEPATWEDLQAHLQARRVPAWLAEALDAIAVGIAGALNVLGLKRTVITGSLATLPSAVFDYLSAAITRGAMWARFGRVHCEIAPRRRLAGLVAVGIDQFVIPSHHHRRDVAA